MKGADGVDGGDGGGGGDRGDGVEEGEGVTGVVRLTSGRYPPSYLECLSHQDSENIAHC